MADTTRARLPSKGKLLFSSAIAAIALGATTFSIRQYREGNEHKARDLAKTKIASDTIGLMLDLDSITGSTRVTFIDKNAKVALVKDTGNAFTRFCKDAQLDAIKPMVNTDPGCALYARLGIVSLHQMAVTVAGVAQQSTNTLACYRATDGTRKNGEAVRAFRQTMDNVVAKLPPPPGLRSS